MAEKGKLGKKLSRNVTKRPERLQRYKYIFLVVCEDEKTEPEYFSQFINLFPPKTLYLKPIGAGRDSLGVVERAIDEKANLSKEIRKEIDCVWVIFDRDDAHLDKAKRARFQDSLKMAKKTNLRLPIVTKFLSFGSYYIWKIHLVVPLMMLLQRFALKPEPRIILKALLRNAFKIILVVRLIGNCCKYSPMHRDEIY